MFDARKIMNDYQKIADPQERFQAIREAVKAADEAKDISWSFSFREHYMSAASTVNDDAEMTKTFSEMKALYDSSEELRSREGIRSDLLLAYRLMIMKGAESEQVSLDTISGYLADYETRLKADGHSLHSAHYLREVVSEVTGNLLPEEEYGKYHDENENSIPHCDACEWNHDMAIQFALGNAQKAIAMAAPVFSGEISCEKVPAKTFAQLVAYYTKTGEYDAAMKFAKHLFPQVRRRPELLKETGILLRYYAAVNPQMGVLVFRQTLPDFMRSSNQLMRFYFAEGAARLFRSIQGEQLTLILPPDFAMWKEDFRYDTAAMGNYFFDIAKELAEKYDARNGNSCMTDLLGETLPLYDESVNAAVRGECEQTSSVLGAVCTRLPEELTIDSITKILAKDGRYIPLLSRAEQSQGVLAFQIGVNDGSTDIYQVMITIQPVPPVEEFRPATPIADHVVDEVKNAEGVVLFIMPFEEKQPDLALHFQLKLMHLICPDAVTYLDFSRMKMLPAGWVTMTAKSDIPPLVDYLYNLKLHGNEEDNQLWITTRGLRACGMREIEILDATKENFPRYCDMISFAVEQMLLKEEMPDAKQPFTLVYDQNEKPVECTWLPMSEAKADYENDAQSGWGIRSQILEREVIEFDSDAVLYMYDREGDEIKRLSTLTKEDFDSFRYGSFIISSKKIAAMARERVHILARMMQTAPDQAYACVRITNEPEIEEAWMKLEKVTDKQLSGVFAEDCSLGKEGTAYTADVAQLTDFSVQVGENLMVHPNTAYIGLEID
ncbi:MAG: hypothetical protein MJ071_05960 [Oscillospiraceae bacterium]|nr:hypothetical protein [Oscillospiraceae bacterium]